VQRVLYLILWRMFVHTQIPAVKTQSAVFTVNAHLGLMAIQIMGMGVMILMNV